MVNQLASKTDWGILASLLVFLRFHRAFEDTIAIVVIQLGEPSLLAQSSCKILVANEVSKVEHVCCRCKGELLEFAQPKKLLCIPKI